MLNLAREDLAGSSKAGYRMFDLEWRFGFGTTRPRCPTSSLGPCTAVIRSKFAFPYKDAQGARAPSAR